MFGLQSIFEEIQREFNQEAQTGTETEATGQCWGQLLTHSLAPAYTTPKHLPRDGAAYSGAVSFKSSSNPEITQVWPRDNGTEAVSQLGFPLTGCVRLTPTLRHHGIFTQTFWCLPDVEVSGMDRGRGTYDLPGRTQG